MILYAENPRDSTKRYYIKSTNPVKLQDTKINIQMSAENPRDSTKRYYIKSTNPVKLQDTKINIRMSAVLYTLTMNSLKYLKKDSIYNSIKNNKIIRNKFNQGGEKYVH